MAREVMATSARFQMDITPATSTYMSKKTISESASTPDIKQKRMPQEQPATGAIPLPAPLTTTNIIGEEEIVKAMGDTQAVMDHDIRILLTKTRKI